MITRCVGKNNRIEGSFLQSKKTGSTKQAVRLVFHQIYLIKQHRKKQWFSFMKKQTLEFTVIDRLFPIISREV